MLSNQQQQQQPVDHKLEVQLDKLKLKPSTSSFVVQKEETQPKIEATRVKRHEVDINRAACDPSTLRKCLMTDFYFLDYYHDFLTYLHLRKQRLTEFKSEAYTLRWDAVEYQRQWKLFTAKESQYLRLRRKKPTHESFSVIAQIGQGGYGQVFLARLKQHDHQIVALKVMNKRLLSKMGETTHIESERDVLTQTSKSDWLVKLFYAFQDPQNVYLAMEFVPGGDLRTLLNNSGILRESDAQFYMAEMCMATDALHQLGYIHRDLKPENFLIDAQGHLKLTDFGLCTGKSINDTRVESLRGKLEALKDARIIRYSSLEKRAFHSRLRLPEEDKSNKRAFSLCGSPDYMAYEILSASHNNASPQSTYAEGYDYKIDYWSLGAILFEFLAGFAPFAAQTNDEVWINLYHWQEVLERPQYDVDGEDAEFNLSNEAWDMITSLITFKDKRLCTLGQVYGHKWFSQFNGKLQQFSDSRAGLKRKPATMEDQAQHQWNMLKSVPDSVVSPPFVPELNSDIDNKHFDDFTDPQNLQIYKDVYDKQKNLTKQFGVDDSKPFEGAVKRNFIGFTYRHRGSVDFESTQ